ncbi:exodeoxyribonuclease III [Flavobacteriaceae bacterium]|nr:exodeoxyribonuclease III [Flavobacteriaceae bacterium]MDA9893221.1 exodeoxyribonuclease III [Flavobacteriaceae bacterium]MDB2339980.1 exodeoxyribonuclease III [Flavobacteriaceae bacterium]MDC3259888.1 exodeoxyribonuclease III [Flavobacteriaceae bacterium]MDC3368876.1 exodeoxyribonuclease III [Flavobacteriaceae bacterium]
MKVLSYNVNGIRAALNKGFAEWLKVSQADVICIQEIKALKEQVDTKVLEDLGYHHFWFSAQKKGYSGVAIFSKIKPNKVEYGSGIDHMDFEGRIIRADFDKVSIMSLYLPSGTNIDRLEYKFKFMDEFQDYINELKKEYPNLIICGDYNICHEAIDIHDPVRNKKVSGFLPEERAWLDGFINSGFIDSFRLLNSEPHHYSWWSYRANARNNNKGWRIDYALVSAPLKENIKRSFILPEAKHSDHCPVGLELNF